MLLSHAMMMVWKWNIFFHSENWQSYVKDIVNVIGWCKKQFLFLFANMSPRVLWIAVARRDVLNMLHTVFSTLTVAMRYEPANAKFFTTEVSPTFDWAQVIKTDGQNHWNGWLEGGSHAEHTANRGYNGVTVVSIPSVVMRYHWWTSPVVVCGEVLAGTEIPGGRQHLMFRCYYLRDSAASCGKYFSVH